MLRSTKFLLIAASTLFVFLGSSVCVHAQSLGSVSVVGTPHIAPCNFPTPGNDALVPNGNSNTMCYQLKVSGCAGVFWGSRR